MKVNVKEEVVLEREIDVEDLLCVLKHESEIGNPGRKGNTVRVDKNLLKDVSLVIEKLLDNHNYEYDGDTELVEKNEKLKDTITKLEEQIEGCNKTFNDCMETNRQLSKDVKISRDKISKLILENEMLKENDISLNNSACKLKLEVEEKEKENEMLKKEFEVVKMEKECLIKMLSRKSLYEPPKVSLDKTKEAKDKVEMVKLRTPDVYGGWDMELMDALAGILLHGLAL